MGTVTRHAIEKTWLTVSNAKKNLVGAYSAWETSKGRWKRRGKFGGEKGYEEPDYMVHRGKTAAFLKLIVRVSQDFCAERLVSSLKVRLGMGQVRKARRGEGETGRDGVFGRWAKSRVSAERVLLFFKIGSRSNKIYCTCYTVYTYAKTWHEQVLVT